MITLNFNLIFQFCFPKDFKSKGFISNWLHISSTAFCESIFTTCFISKKQTPTLDLFSGFFFIGNAIPTNTLTVTIKINYKPTWSHLRSVWHISKLAI